MNESDYTTRYLKAIAQLDAYIDDNDATLEVLYVILISLFSRKIEHNRCVDDSCRFCCKCNRHECFCNFFKKMKSSSTC